ncbi:hypothetical protein GQ54DRAFT_296204 [Martensiomyces pterosporus]|nr:hypothetical protein GQ54DRAFT_296204 [Martensiomyces pterosporus]
MVRIHTLSLLAAIGLCLAGSLARTHDQPPYHYVGKDTVCSVAKNGTQDCYPRAFEAKPEFQVVRPGQDVPPGLHIQVDMETGERRARLMDTDGEKNALAIVPDTNKDAGSHHQAAVATGHGSDGFQSYIDRIVDLSTTPADRPTDGSVVGTLGEMEELVHDTRYADQLMKDPLAVPALLRLSDPSTSHGIPAWPASVRQMSSVVLGSTVQNNQRLQGIAYRAGAIPSLLHILEDEDDLKAAGKHVFALSSLVRGHPGALEQFAQRGGLRVLSKLSPTSDSDSTGDRSGDASKLELRVVRFVEDLFNPDFNPGQSQDSKNIITQNAPVWCKILANKLVDDLWAIDSDGETDEMYERRQVYAHALLSLKTQYKSTCELPGSWKPWVRDELGRVAKEKSNDVEEYKQILTDLSN